MRMSKSMSKRKRPEQSPRKPRPPAQLLDSGAESSCGFKSNFANGLFAKADGGGLTDTELAGFGFGGETTTSG